MITRKISFTPIGIIHTPFKRLDDMPVQPSAAQGIRGQIIINDEYRTGLSDLDGFSHVYLIYFFHLSEDYQLKVIPFLDDQVRGVFATRAPKRPNAIGLSVVKLIQIRSNIIDIENVDMVNDTPLLDIKPYVAEMEPVSDYKIGWLSEHKVKLKSHVSDKRFK